MSKNGSSTPFMGFNLLERDAILTSHKQARQAPPFADSNDVVEHELIPTTSRLSRLPTKVPLDLQQTPFPSPITAISAHQTPQFNPTSGQDVHLLNNSASSIRSPATSTLGFNSPLGTAVSSFPSPLTQNELKHPIRRPRTSTQIFQSSSDLTAHYGIPQRLPPAPSTSSRQPQSPFKDDTDLADFATLSQNYINMLSNKDTTDPVASYQASPMPPPLSSTVLADPIPEAETLDRLAALIVASPEYRQYSDFMTSPMMPDLDSGISPGETPFEDFLNTPLIDQDEFDTSPMLPLFPDFEEPYVESVPKSPTTLNAAQYRFSPASPSIDEVESFPAPASSSSRRVSKANGIRKGITVDALLDENAPTQLRKYLTPSATSKKEVPATFARKRARSEAFGDEEDELGEEGPLNETEKQMIEQKRHKNTLAARKSRRRKLEQYQNMEKSRDEERRYKQVWKERAMMLLQTVRKQGVNYPDFPEDDLEFEHV